MAEEKKKNNNNSSSDPKNLPVVLQSTKKMYLSSELDNFKENEEHLESLRIIPIKETVVLPHNIIPLTAGKEWKTEHVDRALRIGGAFGVITVQENKANKEKIEPQDLYDYGTEVRIVKVIRFPDSSYGAVVQGLRRFRVLKHVEKGNHDFLAKVDYIDDLIPVEDKEAQALLKNMKLMILKAIKLSPNIPSDANVFIDSMNDPNYLVDMVVPYLSIPYADKQKILETEDYIDRLNNVYRLLVKETEILEISQRIHDDVRNEMNQQQKRYFLREQIRMLQKELGESEGRKGGGSGSFTNEPDALLDRVEKAELPKDAKEAALHEIERLQNMQPGAPEYTVSTTYVNWLLSVPWNKTTQKAIDIKVAEKMLHKDHYGLEKVKKRILEFLAVYKLKGDLRGPILLLEGPPGVGKTSLGKSIAKSLGRKFIRIALGGVRDESEIRGHRRTYIGSMPGKIVDALKKADSMDPVILLDEVDKLASDSRGDPSSALLEVLDPEQNHTFTDHYLNVPVDLSKVLFIATANTLSTIPAPLFDRMECISLSSYTLEEKAQIGIRHLLPAVLKDHGVDRYRSAQTSKEVVKKVVQSYTREAGVRQLKRELASMARGIAKELVEQGIKPRKSAKGRKAIVEIRSSDVEKYLGRPRFIDTLRKDTLPRGVSTGLAYTSVGGDILYVEAVKSPGNGKLSLTGQLGDVMKESIQTAMAYIKAHEKSYRLPKDAVSKHDIHVHFPAGAVPKDGPSAGVAVFLALMSLYLDKPLPAKLACTGEISLRGDVLPVGGIKEKLLAAHRMGVKKIILPLDNEKDLEDLPKDVLDELDIVLLSDMDLAYEEAWA